MYTGKQRSTMIWTEITRLLYRWITNIRNTNGATEI